MKIQSIRGFNDILAADAGLWQRLGDTARQVFEAYGYAEVRLPVLERIELFKRAVGEVTDVVEKEMYAFEDRGGEKVAMRPEFTAGLVRAGIEHGLFDGSAQRLWCAGPVFRYERPQAGRYRQFHQLDLEAYGVPGPDIDAEVIAVSARLWKRLGFQGLTLELNSLGEAEARARYRAALIAYFEGHAASLDEDARRRLHSNPLRILDSKVPTTQAIAREAPLLADYLSADCRAHFEGLQRALGDLGIAFVINPRLVRGLDYYTRTVFEWTTDALGAQGTVCAGGRYDRLVEQLGGPATPAVGWACGMERLILLLQAQAGAAAAGQAPQVYLCRFGEQAEAAGLRLAERLRDALPELRLMVNVRGGKPAVQFKRADKSGAALALVLGDDEAARQTVQVKSLRATAGPAEALQTEVPWTELSAHLQRLLSQPSAA
ncbi:MAG TPA: histidine--tRNA ligase [Nevskiaceae bacterium]|nr:histidine--tRNA ligase [Nevskiaceae bacterium]